MKNLLFTLLLVGLGLYSKAQKPEEIATKIDNECQTIENSKAAKVAFTFNILPKDDYANQYVISGFSRQEGTAKIEIKQSPKAGVGFYRIVAYFDGNRIIKQISEEGQGKSYSKKVYYLINNVIKVVKNQQIENNKATSERIILPQAMNSQQKSVFKEDQKWVQEALNYFFKVELYPPFTKF